MGMVCQNSRGERGKGEAKIAERPMRPGRGKERTAARKDRDERKAAIMR
jgi:hypothetical protein